MVVSQIEMVNNRVSSFAILLKRVSICLLQFTECLCFSQQVKMFILSSFFLPQSHRRMGIKNSQYIFKLA